MVTATAIAKDVVSVPRLWPGETVVCLGTGPSLTAADVEFCRGKARVIAIKNAMYLAPWADVLYCGDEKWWVHHGPSLQFAGMRYALSPEAKPEAGPYAQVLKWTGLEGLELAPTGLRSGKQSGYQAIGLARHFGATRIILLGYDMQPSVDGRGHFFGEHTYSKKPKPWELARLFDTLVAPLAALGITVLNASRRTALKAFPCVSLEEALA